MKLTSYVNITSAITKEIRQLEETVQSADRFESELYLAENLNIDPSLAWVFTIHDDNQLVSALQIFAPAKSEMEIMGFTHPDYRKQGYFTSLVETVKGVWKQHDLPSLLYVVNGKSKSGQAYALGKGADHEFTEYLMEWKSGQDSASKERGQLSTLPAKRQQLEVLADIQHQTFGIEYEGAKNFIKGAFDSEQRHTFISYYQDRPVGMGAIAVESDMLSIYGVCILPEFQGLGLGKELMQHLLKESRRLSDQKVTLEVKSSNMRAFELYRKLGFEVVFSNEYYRQFL